MTAALLINTSRRGSLWLRRWARSRTDERLARSTASNCTLASGTDFLICAMACAPRSGLRAAMITSAPARASASASS